MKLRLDAIVIQQGEANLMQCEKFFLFAKAWGWGWGKYSVCDL